jgi:hypothetical protein
VWPPMNTQEDSVAARSCCARIFLQQPADSRRACSQRSRAIVTDEWRGRRGPTTTCSGRMVRMPGPSGMSSAKCRVQREIAQRALRHSTSPRGGNKVPAAEEARRALRTAAGEKAPGGLPCCHSRPSNIRAIRWARVTASSWSWVTTRVVTPVCLCADSMRERISSRRCASRLARGSSRRRSLGSITSARARATR